MDDDEFEVERSGPPGELRLGGDLDMASAPILEKALTELRDDGVVDVVLDMERVSFVDSQGLRVFLRAMSDGSVITLRNASPMLLRLIDISGLTNLIVTV